MTEDERLSRLASALLQRTKAGVLDWQQTDRPDLFLVTLNSGSVTIATRDADGMAPYELVVLNPDGVAIERLESSKEPSVTELHEFARRAAFTVDATLDGLIDELNG